MSNDQLKQLWQSQGAPGVALSTDQLRRQAGVFQRRVLRRNALEYGAGLAVMLVFAFYIWAFPHALMRIGCVLIMLGCAWALVQMRRRAGGPALAWTAAELPSLEAHRRELVRQRDALRSVWLWYVGPFVPGMVVFRWGVETELDASAPFARGLVPNLVIAAVLLAVVWINRRAANKLQRQLDQLERAAA